MDNLDSFLKGLQSEGQVVSSGSFTLDLRKAREKLSRYQLAEPCFYLMKVLQAVVAARAERVDVCLGRNSVRLFAGVPRNGPLKDSQPLVEGLQDPQGLGPGALRHLCIGFNSAWALEPIRISFTYWDTNRSCGWQLIVGQKEIQIEPAGQMPEKPAGTRVDRVMFSLERPANVSSYVRSIASEHQGILHRCAFCPVPLYLDSLRVIGQWSVPSGNAEPWMGGAYLLAERFRCSASGGLRLSAPPWNELQESQGCLLNGREISLTEGSGKRPPTFCFQGNFGAISGPDTLRCEAALAVPSYLSGPSRVILVQDGVTLEPIALDKPHYYVGLQALLSAPYIRTDLSEFGAIQDDELRRCLNEVMAELDQMLDELIQFVHLAPHHKLTSSDAGIAAGCGMMVGCLFFNVVGLTVVALQQWLKNNAEKRARLANRLKLRDYLKTRLEALRDERLRMPGGLPPQTNP